MVLLEHWILGDGSPHYLILGSPFIFVYFILKPNIRRPNKWLFYSFKILNPGGTFEVIRCILETILQSADVF